MRNYWVNSKFADWIRGTDKLEAGTNQEWSQWEKESKEKHPIRYWIAEELLDSIQNVVRFPIDKLYKIKYYINNRWVTKTHCLTAHSRDISIGKWCDVSNRILFCLFNELVNFVEIELASHHIAWSEDDRKKYNAPFWAVGWFKWRTWRCPKAGLDNLEWQMTLTESSPDQAAAAKEILELYNWWTITYRNRPSPSYASGWSSYSARRNFDGSEPSDIEKEEMNKIFEKYHEIELRYHEEDEAMLIRLIKIRTHLWT